jgi:hypothetical protein
MRKFGIAGLRLRKRHVTTAPEPCATPVPDTLGCDFIATALNTKPASSTNFVTGCCNAGRLGGTNRAGTALQEAWASLEREHL